MIRLLLTISLSFVHLFSHRFASHCCEALFLNAAPAVTEEMKALAAMNEGMNGTAAKDEIYVSMENLFLHTLAELEGSVGYLMTDTYASHVLRVLLLVLAGEPLGRDITKHTLQSKRKETVTVSGQSSTESKPTDKTRNVPKSFSQALEKLIAESVAGLDAAQLRALATHPNANPTLQLLLKLELVHFGKHRAKDETSIIRKLFPDDPITAESESAAFIGGLVYDPVGSHLVEQIVEHAPGKLYKNLYKEFFHDRLASLARNEIAGYVVCRVLERMGRDDLLEAHEMLIPIVPRLLESDRTMVLRTLIERCSVRQVDTQAIAVQLDAAFGGPDGFSVLKLLKVGETPQVNGDTPHDSVQSSTTDAGLEPPSRPREPAKVHFNILAQAMIVVPGPLSSLIFDSLDTLGSPDLLRIAKDPIVSRTLQAALTATNASLIQKRKLIQRLYGRIGELALDKAASHVVDCIWEGTHGLAFIRERIAEELAENEGQMRESQYGRAVWKNWKMDMYKRRRSEWIRQSKIKASNDGFQSFSEVDANKTNEMSAKKTPLQLARERHAKNRAAKDEQKGPAAVAGRSGSGRGGATSTPGATQAAAAMG